MDRKVGEFAERIHLGAAYTLLLGVEHHGRADGRKAAGAFRVAAVDGGVEGGVEPGAPYDRKLVAIMRFAGESLSPG